MPQAKHTFVESKMNKDLDDRLLSGGQYRNAVNIAVSKSDDSNVGALENVLGNYNISSFFPSGYNIPVGVEIIGSYFNTVSNDIIVFITNFIDPINPSNTPYVKTNAYANSSHFINIYNTKTEQAKILVEGLFLNFSINNKVLGVDIAEDYLFWTDNRNQPRKINWKTALNSGNYYKSEDTISILKYSPYQPIEVHEETVITDVITTSVATSVEVETYNSSTQTYGTQDLLAYCSSPAVQSPYGKVVFSNASIENIPLYTYFRLKDSNGGDSILLQIFAKDPNNNTLYTWPRITNTSKVWEKVTFFNSNMRDTTSKHLPPSARFYLNSTSGVKTNVSAPTSTSQGYAVFKDTTTKSFSLSYLNGGTNIDAGSGIIGDNDNVQTDERAAKYGLPLALFGNVISTSSPKSTQLSYFETTTGLKANGEWIPTKITSNTLEGRDTTPCFLINSTITDAQEKFQSSFGLPELFDQSASAIPWNLGLSDDISFSFGSHYFDLSFPNPHYDPKWAGDSENLKDKFVRFAYRFKFDDGEYSLISPFTQPLFIPEQDGYFINNTPRYNKGLDTTTRNQLKLAGENTIVDFMENKCTDFKLDIPTEYKVNELNSKLKVVEIDILYKESDGLALKLIDTIDTTSNNTKVSNNSTNILTYKYQSAKPFKTLPSSEITRTSDKAPIRALSQAISGNRVIYGNFVDKHGSPATLDYETSVSEKSRLNVSGSSKAKLRYPNHTVKQGRTYQVGVVLSDRYGRQTDVILSPPKEELRQIPLGDGTTLDFGDSTIYHKYKSNSFDPLEWTGDSLKLLFNSAIPSSLPSVEGYPGLYNGDPSSSSYNPLGFYTYKIVVKQKEQDYYNVFVPSLMLGQPSPGSVQVNWNGLGDGSLVETVTSGGFNITGLESTLLLEVGMIFNMKGAGANCFNDQNGPTFVITEIVDENHIRFSPPVPNFFPNGNPNSLYNGVLGGGTVGLPNNCCNPGSTEVCYQNFTITFTRPGSFDGTWLGDSMTTTLLGDNINKIPPELIDVRPTQSMYGSSDLGIIPRVARFDTNQLSFSSNSGNCVYNYVSQVDPGIKKENVSVLGNWNDIVSEEFASNLYEESKNPVVAIMSNTFRIGSNKNSKQYSAVFETEPVVSNLDIFWETSSSGLISELNERILVSDDPVEASFGVFSQDEATDYKTTPSDVFEVSFKDSAGNVLTTLVSVALLSVTDTVSGQPNVLTSEYEMGVNSGGVYSVKAKERCVFLHDQDRNNRVFTFRATTISGSQTDWSSSGTNLSILNSSPNLYVDYGVAKPQPPYVPTPSNNLFSDLTIDLYTFTNSGYLPGNPYKVYLDNGSAEFFDPAGYTPSYTKWRDVGLTMRVEKADGTLFNSGNSTAGFSWEYNPGCFASCSGGLDPYPNFWLLKFDPSVITYTTSDVVYLNITGFDAVTGNYNSLTQNSNSLTVTDFSVQTNESRIKVSFIDTTPSPVTAPPLETRFIACGASSNQAMGVSANTALWNVFQPDPNPAVSQGGTVLTIPNTWSNSNGNGFNFAPIPVPPATNLTGKKGPYNPQVNGQTSYGSAMCLVPGANTSSSCGCCPCTVNCTACNPVT